jgi:hypothetical protein
LVVVTASRNGRGRTSAQRQPAQPTTPPAADNYALLIGGLVSCRRCACLLQDTRPARDQHDNHHAALRAMYERIGDRP